jgi:hypothetical protein
VDELKLAVILAAALAGGVLAACGGDPGGGTLGAHTNGVKLSIGSPAKPGKILTATQMAVTYHDGKGITIESVQPLGLHGPAHYLGTALLLPPRQGFEMNLSHHFPTIALHAHWARLPYTTTTASGGINLGVGFDLRTTGATSFAGLAVRYRQHGHEYVAVVPLGIRVCVSDKTPSHSCDGPSTAQIPEESVRPA